MVYIGVVAGTKNVTPRAVTTQTSLHHTTSESHSTLEDGWFAALNGRAIHIGPDSNVIHIFGIHRVGDDLWLQLAPFQDRDSGTVIRCRCAQAPAAVLEALRVYLASNGSVLPTLEIDLRWL